MATIFKISFAFYFNLSCKKGYHKSRILTDVWTSHVVYEYKSLMTNTNLFIISIPVETLMNRKLDHEPIVAFLKVSNLCHGTKEKYENLFKSYHSYRFISKS